MPFALTVSGITANNKVYDRTTAANLNVGSASLVGVFSGNTVNLGTGSAAGTFASANVGNGIAVGVSGLTISGSSADNYTLTQPTATADITAKALTETGLTVPASHSASRTPSTKRSQWPSPGRSPVVVVQSRS